MKETPFRGAAVSLVLIIAACGPDSISEWMQIWLNCTYLPSVILGRLSGCVGAFVLTGLEVRGSIFPCYLPHGNPF